MMRSGQTIENIHIYHTNKHALFFYNISQYICQLPHIFGLKQVFAQAWRNDNINIQTEPPFALSQFIKATRHFSMAWNWKRGGKKELEDGDCIRIQNKIAQAFETIKHQTKPSIVLSLGTGLSSSASVRTWARLSQWLSTRRLLKMAKRRLKIHLAFNWSLQRL